MSHLRSVFGDLDAVDGEWWWRKTTTTKIYVTRYCRQKQSRMPPKGAESGLNENDTTPDKKNTFGSICDLHHIELVNFFVDFGD